MAPENVEIVRATFAAWNAGDMDAVRENYDPEAIMRTPKDWPEQGPFVGREAVMREWEQLRETFAFNDAMDAITDPEEVGDRVVVRSIWRGVGQGPSSNIELTMVVGVRERRIFAQDFFRDHTEGLDAARLPG